MQQMDLKDFHREGKALIEHLASALVDDPSSVSVEFNQGEQTTVFELRVAKPEIGRIIGKAGRNAKAIRTILNGFATKCRRRAVVEIVE